MKLNIYCDGGARGNPGPAAGAFVVYDGAGNMRQKGGKFLGERTNNEAEYEAVNMALEWVKGEIEKLKGGEEVRIEFFLDSRLVVNQLNGVFRVKGAKLAELLFQARGEERQLSEVKISYQYVPRERNFEADRLVNELLDRELGFH